MIEVVLSDGRTLRSPPFAKREFDADYRATLRGDHLTIEAAKP
jgi:hypothetical protein